MPNTIITSEMVAKEALALLVSNCVAGNLVRRDMDDEFTAGKGDVINVRKRSGLKANAFTGQTQAQNLNESKVPVKLDKIRDVTVEVSSKELTLDIAKFSEQVLEPQIVALKEAIDADILATLVANADSNETQSETPKITDIGKLSKKLDKNRVLTTGRVLIFGTDHKYDYLATDNLIKAAYAGDNRALREADCGRLYGMDTYMDQNAPEGKGATSGTATSYKVAGTAGQSKVALSALSAATATVKEGEGFIFDGVFYKFTANGTGESSAIAEIAIDQPLHKTVTANDTIKIIAKNYSVAFQKDCVVFASRPMELPATGEGYVASANGFSVRVTYGYDMNTKKNMFSIDVLYGVKVVEPKGVVSLG